MSLNFTVKNKKQKNKKKSKLRLKKPKPKKPKLTLTEVHFDNFEIEKNKVQIRETDENNEEILHDAHVLSVKGEINFTFQFIWTKNVN